MLDTWFFTVPSAVASTSAISRLLSRRAGSATLRDRPAARARSEAGDDVDRVRLERAPPRRVLGRPRRGPAAARSRRGPPRAGAQQVQEHPLQAALLAGQLATARLLLERGADPLVRQARGFTPLHGAALLGRRDLVDLLLGAGAEINSRSDDGRTPVTEALRGKHAELADYLRGKGGHGAEITANLNDEPKD